MSSRGESLDILLLVRDFPPKIGGRASLFRELARHLPADRTRLSTPWALGAGAVDRHIPCRVLRARVFGDPSRGLGSRMWASHLRRVCRANPPQIVLAGGLVPEGLFALDLKREHDIPYLLHLEAPQIVRLREKSKDPEVTDAVLREIVAGSNGILVGSQACWMEAYRLGIYPHDLQRIPVGVDLDRFHPGEASSGLRSKLRLKNGPVLLSVTGQAPVDEIATLLRAFSTLTNSKRGATLVLVGQVPDEPISKLAKELGVLDSLRFLRAVPDREMPDLFRLADVFVLAGREDRTHGLVDGIQFAALEALASGVPVVGARTRTTDELIPDGDAGLLVEPGSPGKLARALQSVLESGERSADFARSAREHAEKEWDAKVAASRLREILEVVYYRRLRRGTLAPAKETFGETLSPAV